jgi:hypothetical protein
LGLAVAESLIIFWFTVAGISSWQIAVDLGYGGEVNEITLAEAGMAMLYTIVLIVAARSLLIENVYWWWMWLAWLLQIGAFYLNCWLDGGETYLIDTGWGTYTGKGFYLEWPQFFDTWQLELFVPLVLTTVLGPSILWKCYRRRFWPSLLHLLQEQHVFGVDAAGGSMQGAGWSHHHTKGGEVGRESTRRPFIDGDSSSFSGSFSTAFSSMAHPFGMFVDSAHGGGEQMPLVASASLPTNALVASMPSVQPLPLLGRQRAAHTAGDYGYGATQPAAEALPLATVVSTATL